ncbi:AfsR/SARP family transcriptional regulator [Catellatospora sp. KI3]|uniref:AfsR/SARP family transcriptional regulator n=1 Tax=Catellatospora sp. KI3 TaxID=3041620 RepID=UPI002483157E|nr:AfsR/SARP family transcriptional regulator [Catellatospora sp. KI3]MDI1461280.1 AfsR/SARP family transcriptional regulator [Catellatospora sp. KI3]
MPIFQVLGPVEVTGQGGPPDRMLPAKPRTLLAALLLRPNQWVPTAHLVETLWERPPRSAHGNLRTYVWQLRTLLAGTADTDRLDSRLGLYRLAVQPGEIDMQVFTELSDLAAEALAAGEAAAAERLLLTALRLWRGDPFEDVPALLSQPKVVRLREQRWSASEMLAEARLMLGQSQRAVDDLRPLLAEQPFREQMWILLMHGLTQLGRRADALAAYREVSHLLSSELGLEPGPRLRDAQRMILTGAA